LKTQNGFTTISLKALLFILNNCRKIQEIKDHGNCICPVVFFLCLLTLLDTNIRK
jgi:hypothetical protein